MVLTFRPLAQIINIFVLPDIRRRIEDGTIKDSELPLEISAFRAYQHKLSDGKISLVVKLNKEVKPIFRTKLKNKEFSKEMIGEVVNLSEIDADEFYLLPPEYEGKPCGYFYFNRIFFIPRFIFDCTPNVPGISNEEAKELRVKYPVADHVKEINFVQAVTPYKKMEILVKNNWPPSPGYYPNVFAEMHNNKLGEQDFTDVVAKSFNNNYWDAQTKFWEETDFFPKRINYIKSAINAHFDKKYADAIYIICPQFEGILRDYLKKNEREVGSYKDNLKVFKDLLYVREMIIYPKKVLDTALDFLGNGTFLKRASKVIPDKEVNRHGVLHGIHTNFECQEISLKYLILLDCLAFLILSDKIVTNSI